MRWFGWFRKRPQKASPPREEPWFIAPQRFEVARAHYESDMVDVTSFGETSTHTFTHTYVRLENTAGLVLSRRVRPEDDIPKVGDAFEFSARQIQMKPAFRALR